MGDACAVVATCFACVKSIFAVIYCVYVESQSWHRIQFNVAAFQTVIHTKYCYCYYYLCVLKLVC